jgi:hypothetical protein
MDINVYINWFRWYRSPDLYNNSGLLEKCFASELFLSFFFRKKNVRKNKDYLPLGKSFLMLYKLFLSNDLNLNIHPCIKKISRVQDCD